MIQKVATFFLCLILSPITHSEEEEKIRVGALAYGTLAWELAALERERPQQGEGGVRIQTQILASPEAGRIALQGHTVDLIVSDWIFVAQQRLKGQDFTFVPFSSLHGALVVPRDATIRKLSDLKSKKIGIAGGGLDKNWLLLREAAKKAGAIDLEKEAEIQFGAPPLLTESLRLGKIDAVLTYWNQATKLEQQGYRILLDGQDLQEMMGLKTRLPTLGYIFRASFAREHPKALESFLDLTAKARTRLCSSEMAFEAIAKTVQEPDPATRKALQKAYCDRTTLEVGMEEKSEAARLFSQLEFQGGAGTPFPEGVFFERVGH